VSSGKFVSPIIAGVISSKIIEILGSNKITACWADGPESLHDENTIKRAPISIRMHDNTFLFGFSSSTSSLKKD
jgi:hypothetical protein